MKYFSLERVPQKKKSFKSTGLRYFSTSTTPPAILLCTVLVIGRDCINRNNCVVKYDWCSIYCTGNPSQATALRCINTNSIRCTNAFR